MPPKTTPSGSDWENQKEAIRHLYLGQDLHLQVVRRQLEDSGFIATKAQYEAKFKEWGFSKNVPVITWKHLGYKIEKRKREGKDSAVSINGVEIPIKRVKKETSRHYYSVIECAEFERINAPSPPGSFAVVSTPPSQQEVLIVERWPSNLPWFSFIRFLDTRLEGLPRMQLNPQTFQGGLPFTQKKSQANDNLVEQSRTEISGGRQLVFDIIKEYAPADLNYALLPFSSDVEWPAEIDPSMSLESTSSNHWGLKMLIYLASNKLLSIYNLKVVWKMIEEAGIPQLPNSSYSSPRANVSLAAGMESLLAAAIFQNHTDLVSWVLDTGMSPNRRVKSPYDQDRHLPLTVALEGPYRAEGAQMIRLLLSRGASPLLLCCEKHGSPVQSLLAYSRLSDLETLDAFLESVTDSTLFLSSRSQQDSYCGNEADAEPSVSDEIQDKYFRKMDQLVGLIESRLSGESDSSTSLITPKSLIRAVEYRNETLIRVIHKHGLEMDCCDENKRFPLLAAVQVMDYEGDNVEVELSVVNTLLELGASPNYNPASHAGNSCSLTLQTAIENAYYIEEMVDVIDSLVKSHALVQGSTTCGVLNHRTLMDCALNQEDPVDLISIVNILRNAGLPFPKSALVTALEIAHRNDEIFLHEEIWSGIIPEDPSAMFLRSERGWTALDYATAFSEPWLEKVMVENGVKHSRTFLHFYCIQWRWKIENIEELISRVSAPRNTEQRRDLLFFHLISALRATDLRNRGSECVFKLLEEYRKIPQSLKHDSKLIDVACSSGEAGIIVHILELFPGIYGYGALNALVTCRALDAGRQQEFIIELLKRRKDSCVGWKNETYLLAKILGKDFEVEKDMRILEWFHRYEREAFEYVDLRPSTFTINAFDRNLKKPWRDSDITRWLNYGHKASSYLGLLVVISGQVARMRDLLHQGFRPRRRMSWSLTALQVAVARGDKPMVLLLLDNDCNVNARAPWRDIPKLVFDKIPDKVREVITSHGKHTRRRTALQIAVERGDLPMINLLLDHEAVVNGPAAQVGGATALQLACIKGYIEIVRLLISKTADIYAPKAEYFGRTALEGAAEHGRLDIVSLLLEHDCRLYGSRREQYTRAVGFARSQGHNVLSKFLEESGKWTMEDEVLLARIDLRDKEPYSRDLEEHPHEEDEFSDVDLGELEPEPDDPIWYDTEDEFQLEDDEGTPEEHETSPEDYTTSSEEYDSELEDFEGSSEESDRSPEEYASSLEDYENKQEDHESIPGDDERSSADYSSTFQGGDAIPLAIDDITNGSACSDQLIMKTKMECSEPDEITHSFSQLMAPEVTNWSGLDGSSIGCDQLMAPEQPQSDGYDESFYARLYHLIALEETQCNRLGDSLNGSGQSEPSVETQRGPWDEFVRYDPDEEEEIL